MEPIYHKGEEFVLIDSCNRFVYEVYVYVSFKNYYSIVRHEYFSSEKEINGVVKKYKYSKYIEIYCELYSAPLRWLHDNDYTIYIKPEKPKRNVKKRKTVESSNSGPIDKTTSS